MVRCKTRICIQEEWPSNAVVIVGAGYTGLSAALTLLDSGLKVIIIDKIAGFGALVETAALLVEKLNQVLGN